MKDKNRALLVLTVLTSILVLALIARPSNAQRVQFLSNPEIEETNYQLWATAEARHWSSTVFNSWTPDGYGWYTDWTTHFSGLPVGRVPFTGRAHLSPFVGLQHTRLSTGYAGFYDMAGNFLGAANPQTTLSAGVALSTRFAQPVRTRFDRYTALTVGTRWLLSDDVSYNESRKGFDAWFWYIGVTRNYWVGRAYDPGRPDRDPFMRLFGFQLAYGMEFPNRGECGQNVLILQWDDCAVKNVRSGDLLVYFVPHNSPKSGLSLKLGGGISHWGFTTGPSNGNLNTVKVDEWRPHADVLLTYTPFGSRWSITPAVRYTFEGNTQKGNYLSGQLYFVKRF